MLVKTQLPNRDQPRTEKTPSKISLAVLQRPGCVVLRLNTVHICRRKQTGATSDSPDLRADSGPSRAAFKRLATQSVSKWAREAATGPAVAQFEFSRALDPTRRVRGEVLFGDFQERNSNV